jgi:hypothetical protein
MIDPVVHGTRAVGSKAHVKRLFDPSQAETGAAPLIVPINVRAGTGKIPTWTVLHDDS